MVGGKAKVKAMGSKAKGSGFNAKAKSFGRQEYDIGTPMY